MPLANGGVNCSVTVKTAAAIATVTQDEDEKKHNINNNKPRINGVKRVENARAK